MPHPVIGITGRIGSGKSTAMHHIQKQFDVHHIDLDSVGHMLLTQKEIKRALVKEFGHPILLDDVIHRPALAEIVFKDQTALTALNAIMHPAIFSQTLSLSQEYAKEKTTFIDGALLFEVAINTLCNTTICITAEPQNIEKAIGKDRFKRGAFQLDTVTLEDNCDSVIHNTFTDAFYVALSETVTPFITR